MRLILLVSVCCQSAFAADPQLTIYNQNFAVVRDSVPLDLKAGHNDIVYTGVTAHLEPDSVILRDPAGKYALRVLEQNYRGDTISAELLLVLYEGKTIQFETGDKIIQGKIIRGGSPGIQPLIEIDGKLRFGVPGTPVFPALTSDSILQPTLHWILDVDRAAKLAAELSYVTQGMTWRADYNLVSPENSDKVDLVGWVTMDNHTGRQFDQARIQLMAGDVNKIVPPGGYGGGGGVMGGIAGGMPMAPPPVTERKFDEFHLYTLQNATTLRDRETKQVEFVRADSIASKRIYVYDGFLPDRQYGYMGYDQIRNNPSYGTTSNTKVWVMRQFENTKANQLGIALPKGRVRFYTQDTQGRLQFVGENTIDHTPQGESVSVYAGNAFDLVGSRIRTKYDMQPMRFVEETFEIRVRNRKTVPATVQVVEHLYRGPNATILDNSDPYKQIDSNQIEFSVDLKPDEERVITYRAHYAW